MKELKQSWAMSCLNLLPQCFGYLLADISFLTVSEIYCQCPVTFAIISIYCHVKKIRDQDHLPPCLFITKRGFYHHLWTNLLELTERFTVLSYNILADYLARDHRSMLYFHIPHYIMDWDWRKKRLFLEFGLWSPDIMCLQVLFSKLFDIL